MRVFRVPLFSPRLDDSAGWGGGRGEGFDCQQDSQTEDLGGDAV